MKREERSKKKAAEDAHINRVLVWFGGAFLLELFVLVLDRFYVNFDVNGTQLAYGIARTLRVMLGVCGVLAVVCLFWTLLRQRKGKSVFWPSVLTVVLFVLAGCCAVAALWQTVGVQFLYILVPVVSVLGLIFFLYQREFFLIATLGGVDLFALWTYRKFIGTRPGVVYTVFGLAAVITVGFAVGFLLMRKDRGRFPGRRRVQVVGGKANYALMLTGAGISLAGLAAVIAAALLRTAAAGYTAAYVVLFLVVAWLLGTAIYYTVRLM